MSATKIFTPRLSAISCASLSTLTSNARITAHLKVMEVGEWKWNNVMGAGEWEWNNVMEVGEWEWENGNGIMQWKWENGNEMMHLE